MARRCYARWESEKPPRSFDFHTMTRALMMLGKTFEDITDLVPAEKAAL